MKLKEVYALPVAPAPAMEVPPNLSREYTGWDGTKHIEKYPNRKYTARLVTGPEQEQMLEISAYTYDDIPLWRTWQLEDRVIGEVRGDPPKPSDAGIEYRMQAERNGDWFGTAETDKVIRDWAGRFYYPVPKELSGIKLAAWTQEKAKHKKRDDNYNRIRREIDNDMLKIRELPKDFARWVVQDVFIDCHYIIYKYREKKTETTGYCTRCRHEVTVKKPRNRAPGRCPRCQSSITFLSQATLAQNIHGQNFRKEVAYLQKTDDGLCVRLFHAWLKLDSDSFWELTPTLSEFGRNFYCMEARQFTNNFTYEEFYTTGEVRWCTSPHSRNTQAAIYPHNIKKLLGKGPWRYIPMEKLARANEAMRAEGFLEKPVEDPAIEHLLKHGLTNLAAGRVNGHGWSLKKEEATGIRQVLKLPMDEVRLLQQMNPTTQEYRCYIMLRKYTRVTKETMELIAQRGLIRETDVLDDILKVSTLEKLLGYARGQVDNFPLTNAWMSSLHRCADRKWTPAEVLKEYRDYIVDCKDLGWDLKNDFILFPKNLKEAHKKTIGEVKARKDEILEKKIIGALQALKPLEYKTKDLLVIAPGSRQDIIDEGHKLHHCVGSYAGRVAEGRTIILFIRKKESPREPYCTLEVDPEDMKVRQVRGKNNSAPPAAVMKLLEKWKAYALQIKGLTPIQNAG